MNLRFWRNGAGKTAKVPEPPISLHLEASEPRVLLSADFAGGLLDGNPQDSHLEPLQPGERDLLLQHLNPQLPAIQGAQPGDQQPVDLSHLDDFLFESRKVDDGFVDLWDSTSAERVELIFVDTASPDYQDFVDDLQGRSDGIDYQIFLLDDDQDGMAQIEQILIGFEQVDAIHIVSHAEAGAIKLGNVWLNNDNLDSYQSQLANWSHSVSREADLLFYGCDLVASDEGSQLVDALALLTGMDVAASDDFTGAQSLGGDWDLEVRVGTVETQVAFSSALQAAWQHVLDAPTTTGIADVTVTQGDDNRVIQLLSVFGSDEIPDADLTYTITANTNPGLFLTSNLNNNLNQSANTLLLDFANTHGTADITVRATDDDSETVTTTFTVTVNPNNSLLVTTVGNAVTPGLSFGGGDLVDIGRADLSTGADPNSDGTLSVLTSIAGTTVDGLHVVTSDLTIGTSNSIAVAPGDILFSLATGSTLMSTSDTPVANLTVAAEDIVIMRPDTAGDYSKVNFIMLIDASAVGGGNIKGFTLAQEDTAIGDAFVSAGSFLTTSGDATLTLYTPGDLASSTGNSFSTIIDGTDTRDSTGDRMITQNLIGVDLIENDIILDGKVLKAGSLILTQEVGTDDVFGEDGTNPDTTLAVTKNDLFIVNVDTSSIGSAPLKGTASMLLDGSDADLALTTDDESFNAISLTSDNNRVANADATAVADTYDALNKAILTVDAASGVLSNDSDPDSDSLSAVLVSGPAKSSSFSLNKDGSFSYAHDGSGAGTDTFTYAVHDGKGGVSQNTVTLTITEPAKIRFVTQDNVNTGSASWTDQQIVELGHPGLNLGPTTTGEIATSFDLSNFTGSDGKLTAFHHVQNNLTIGTSNTVAVMTGDLLLAVSKSLTLTSSDASTLDVTDDDIFIFRPDTPGDYSSGVFLRLIEDPSGDGSKIRGVSLVEEHTLVGDKVLQAGSILYIDDTDKRDIKLLSPKNLNNATNKGPVETLIDGDQLNSGGVNPIFTQELQGIELIENDIEIANTTLKSGVLVLASGDSGGNSDTDSVFDNGLAVDARDIYAVTLTSTNLNGTDARGTATLLLDGSDIGLTDDENHEIRGVSLTPAGAPPANADPVANNDTGYVVNEGGSITITSANSILSNDSDADDDALSTVLFRAPKLSSNFTLNADGSFTYTHNGSEATSDSFVYAAIDGKGGLSTATVTITINPTADPAKLFISTKDDVTTGGNSNADSWNSAQVVGFEDPDVDATNDFTFDSGPGSVTTGQFSTDLNLNRFAGGDTTNINALHHVTTSLTIGTTNTVDVQPGDVLISVTNPVALRGSDNVTLNVDKEDVFIFRPDTPGDSSSGRFIALLTDVTGRNVTAISLVESTTNLGGETLNPGDFLFVDDNNDIKLLEPTDLNAVTIGTVTTLVDGGSTFETITGLELIETAITIGDTSFSAGDLLLSQERAGTVLATASVEPQDIFSVDFALINIVSPTIFTGTAERVFDHSDLGDGADDAPEAIDAISLQVAQNNNLPTTANNTITANNDRDFTFSVSDFPFTDADSNALMSVTITALESAGSLKLDGADVTLNQTISRQDIDNNKLTFTPQSGAVGVGYDAFDFLVNDGNGDSATDSTMTIDVAFLNTTPTTGGINDVRVQQGAADTVINLLPSFSDFDDADTDLVYSIDTNSNAGLFTSVTLDQAANTLTLDYKDAVYGMSTITVKATDLNGGTVTTDFDVTVGHGNILLLTTQGGQSASAGGSSTGLTTWEEEELIQLDAPGLSLGTTTAGEFSTHFNLENFTPGDADIDAVHVVTADITIGTANTIDLKAGDLLLSVDLAVTLTGSDSVALAANNEDVIIFRPTNPGDYSAGNFIMLFDDLTRAGSPEEIRALTLVERDTVVGDITLQKGTFLYGKNGVATPIIFTPGDLGAGSLGTHQNLYDSTEESSPGVAITSQDITGIELIERAISIGGIDLAAGDIVLSVGDTDSVMNNGLAVAPEDMFVVTFTRTTAGSNLTDATARLLFDGSDLGLTSEIAQEERIQGISLQKATDQPPTIDLDASAAGLGFTASFTEGVSGAITIVDTDVTITDTNDTQMQGATITLTNAAAGDLLTTGTLPGTISLDGSSTSTKILLTGTASLADYQTALQAISFNNTSEAPDTTDRRITISVNDGELNSDASISTIKVIGSNDAPLLDLDADNSAATGNDYSVTFTEDVSGAVSIVDGDIAISDVDDTNIESATVTLTNAQTGDLLAATGFPQNGISASVSGNVVTLSGSSTLANYQTALQAITFNNTSDSPNTTDRSITVVINDGDANSASATSTVSVVASNDAPTLDLDADNSAATGNDYSVTFTEDVSGAVSIVDGDIAISDVDDTNIESATVTLTNAQTGDLLAAAGFPQNGISASISGNVVTLSGSSTLANYQTALQAITFNNTSDSPNTTDRSITVVINDGDANSASATSTVSVVASNDAPTLDLDADNSAATGNDYSVTFTEDVSGAVSIVDGDIAISDVDDTNIESATVTLTNAQTGDLLAAAGFPQNGISASISGNVVTLSGSSTLANYQTALQAITFNNTSDSPNTTDRSITVVINDGDANSASATSTVSVVASNDAPTAVSGSTVIAEDTSHVFSLADFNFSDLDGDALASVRISSVINNGALTLNGTDVALNQVISAADISAGNLVFTSDANANGIAYATFNYVVNDGSLDAVLASTFTIDVTAINDAPVNNDQAVSTPPNTTYIFTAADFDFTDPDLGDALVSVQITALESVGQLTLNGADVVLNQVISKTDIDAGLLTFQPLANADGPNHDNFAFKVADGSVSSATSATMTINLNTNQRPSAADSVITIDEDTPYTFQTSDIGFTDPDPGDGLVSIEISQLPSDGALSLDGVNVSLGQDISLADLAAGKLTYTPDSNANGNAAAFFEYRVFDGISESQSNTTVTFDINQVNDLPQGSVGILGTGIPDAPLTADVTFVSDADGLGTFSFQWQSNGTDIANETDTSFVPSAANSGETITVIVTYTDGDNTVETLSSDPIIIGETVNLPPRATVLTDITVAEDSGPASVDLNNAFSDPEGENLTVSINSTTDGDLFASITVDANNILLFTPAANAFGSADLTISATDPAGQTVTTTLTINVTAENDSPDAATDLFTIDEDGLLTVSATEGVLSNDTDIENDSLSVIDVTNGSTSVSVGADLAGDRGGVFNISADGSFTFDPGADFQGLSAGQSVDTQVSYTVTDSEGATSTALVRVTVSGNNDSVEPQGDFLSTSANESREVAASIGLLTNDVDVDDTDTLRVVEVSNGSLTVDAGQTLTGTGGGNFTVAADGSYRFDPGSDFTLLQTGIVQTTTVTYVVEDAGGDRRSATLTIDVTGSTIPNPTSSSSLVPDTTVNRPPDVAPQPEPEPERTPEPEPEPDPEPESTDDDDGGSDGGDDEPASDAQPQPGIESLLNEELINVDVEVDPFFTPEIDLSGIGVEVTEFSTTNGLEVNLSLDNLNGFLGFSMSGLNTNEAMGLIGTTDALILISSPDYKDSLDESRNNSQNFQQFTEELRGGTLTVSAGVSIGYVIWLIRSGVIMSSVLSTIPAWRLVDPLPILSNLSAGADADGESIEDIVKSSDPVPSEEPIEPDEQAATETLDKQAPGTDPTTDRERF